MKHCSCHHKHSICNCQHSTCQTPPPQAGFLSKFGITPELVPGIDIGSFEDVDGSSFEGVVMRDADSSKRLVVWKEHTVEMNDRILTPETNIRPEQGKDILIFMQNQLVDNRQRSAKGAEGRAQPPSLDEVLGSVQAARAIATGSAAAGSRNSAAAAAALSNIPVAPDDEDDDDDEEEVHYEEVINVAGISLAAATATTGSHGSRRIAGRHPAKRSRQGATALSSTLRSNRARDVERLDGGGGAGGGNTCTDDVQAEIDKLSIRDILTNTKNQSVKMLIYNGVRPSALRIHVNPPAQFSYVRF